MFLIRAFVSCCSASLNLYFSASSVDWPTEVLITRVSAYITQYLMMGQQRRSTAHVSNMFLILSCSSPSSLSCNWRSVYYSLRKIPCFLCMYYISVCILNLSICMFTRFCDLHSIYAFPEEGNIAQTEIKIVSYANSNQFYSFSGVIHSLYFVQINLQNHWDVAAFSVTHEHYKCPGHIKTMCTGRLRIMVSFLGNVCDARQKGAQTGRNRGQLR